MIFLFRYRTFALILAVLAGLAASQETAMATHEGLDIRILNSKKLFSDFARGGVPDFYPENIRQSQAIILIPNFVKTGFLYAGKYGLGVALARNEQTGSWSAPVFVRVSGGSFGLQAGIQQGEFIVIGVDRFDFNHFRGGATLSGSGSLAFGPWGTHSEIGTGWQLSSRTRAFTKSGGLFAALATDGTVFSFDETANALYYGRGALSREILSGVADPTPNGQELIDEITAFENSADPYESSSVSKRYAVEPDQNGWRSQPRSEASHFPSSAPSARPSGNSQPLSSPSGRPGAASTQVYSPNRSAAAVLPERNINPNNPPRPDYTHYYGKDDLFGNTHAGLNEAPVRYTASDYSSD